MRTPKRPVRDKPVLTVQETAYAVDFGRLDSFAHSERRQNRWDPLRNHRFPRARRSDAKQIMASRRSNFHCSFHMLLTLDLREVQLLFRMYCVRPAVGRTHRLQDLFSSKKLHDLGQRTNSVYIDTLHHRRFRSIMDRHDEDPPITTLCLQGNRENSFDRTQLAR